MTILTREIAYNGLSAFFQNNKPFVLFGTGTSCAVHTDFGMGALKEHLLTEVAKLTLSPESRSQWNGVVRALAKDNDLESAMNAVNDEELTCQIVRLTGEFVSSLDKQHGLRIARGEVLWPTISIIENLVKGLPETDRKLHVATPNYDLLAEYAFERAKIRYVTGYVGGVCKEINWKQADHSMTYHEKGVKGKFTLKSMKHIRFYKVHGSLNTFKLNNTSVENNSWMYGVPMGVERLMITPGTAKHQKLHESRNDLLSEFDQGVASHNAFLFLGFGFNDSQLSNSKIRQKLVDQQCPGVIITRDSNPRIDEILSLSQNLWLVCRQPDNHGTRIFNKRYSDGLLLDNEKLWVFDQFATKILGG